MIELRRNAAGLLLPGEAEATGAAVLARMRMATEKAAGVLEVAVDDDEAIKLDLGAGTVDGDFLMVSFRGRA